MYLITFWVILQSIPAKKIPFKGDFLPQTINDFLVPQLTNRNNLLLG